MRKIILSSNNRFFYVLLLKRSNINTIKLHVPQNTSPHTHTHTHAVPVDWHCGPLAEGSGCVCKCLPVQTRLSKESILVVFL
uniref:Uncharacterized protein n=1 Tax=Anguilla anguilla TaxID=7936 RepID=A0A0E9WSX9_ANGAN